MTATPPPAKRLGPAALAIVVLVALLLLGGLGWMASRSGAATTAPPVADSAAPQAKVIAAGVDGGAFDLVVGHSHHVQEAMTNEVDAGLLIAGREGGTFDPRQTINDAYAKDTYRHFGNAGEDQMPMCKVLDQDPRAVDGPDKALNQGETSAPVACELSDGSTLYVTSWEQ